MTFFEQYSVNGKFTNYSLERMLKDLQIEEEIINELIIRNSISSLTKEFIEKLKCTNEEENITNLILNYFLIADKMKPIACNKKTLSKITGLSERQIDERRRANIIPYIQLTGKEDKKGGRRIILFDPYDVKTALQKYKRVRHGN